MHYARELSKYIQVDIYGACGSLRCPRSQSQTCFDMLDEDYKFYLAFENSNCKDYITEKFFVNGLGYVRWYLLLLSLCLFLSLSSSRRRTQSIQKAAVFQIRAANVSRPTYALDHFTRGRKPLPTCAVSRIRRSRANSHYLIFSVRVMDRNACCSCVIN